MSSFIFKITMKISIFLIIFLFLSIIAFVFLKGAFYIDLSYFTLNEEKSILIPLINTFNIVFCAILLSSIFSISTAIFLCFYVKDNSIFKKIILLCANTLAAIPSIVYGLFAYLFFVIFFNFKISFLSGMLTLSIMALPIILVNTIAAIKSVESDYIKAAYALAFSKNTVIYLVLKRAKKIIFSGIILATAKLCAESAALIYTFGSLINIANIFESGRTMAVHLYVLASEGLFLEQSYASAFVLLLFISLICILFNYLIRKEI
ncbi:ABC transporter permease subunit [Campylobacter canadensis]|uniref:PstA family ABC transporter permease n=1 Tax=Campylobacter canadensis TaxID=449520 RepID=UPI0015556335|nr:ABC transporter permease subunit [Campylobacter canadensis]MBZ7994163.1 ABC transporter permease subunit [Campylobacter canadensis]MBZ7995844.1 ABC transporter permease subunit [Campylobacter canadensis]MBZ7999495.1 ABC transporter permease subunit [Campylobacter canadensis]MBZ8001417.1 ABC transporter permease subunit [Campylobacter canadensis]MBZ8004186.1 ABC transporter permease subunit [Campylobacter canadensis]